jgi:hypothetical protein
MKQSRHEHGIMPTQSQPISTANEGLAAMTGTARQHAIDSATGGLPARLRPAEVHTQKMVGQIAGPFEIQADTSKGASMRDTFVTGLLVIYPAFATVAAIVAGLFLASTNGT